MKTRVGISTALRTVAFAHDRACRGLLPGVLFLMGCHSVQKQTARGSCHFTLMIGAAMIRVRRDADRGEKGTQF